MAIVNGDGDGNKTTVQHGSLLQFHRRFGNLCYDTIVNIARDLSSGIKLTDTKRVICLACAQGKQTEPTISQGQWHQFANRRDRRSHLF